MRPFDQTARARKSERGRVRFTQAGPVVAGSTKDQPAGTYDQAAGTVKEKTGELIGDRELQAKGLLQKGEGHVEAGVGNVKKEFGK